MDKPAVTQHQLAAFRHAVKAQRKWETLDVRDRQYDAAYSWHQRRKYAVLAAFGLDRFRITPESVRLHRALGRWSEQP